jgi:hypothetical protein
MSPTEILAKKVAGPIADTAIAEDVALQDRIARQKERYYATVRTQVPPRRLSSTLESIILERTREPGAAPVSLQSALETVPGGSGAVPAVASSREALPATDVRHFQRILNQTVQAIPDLEGGNARAIAEREGGSIRSLREVQALGIQTDLPSVSNDQADRIKVILKPKPLKPEQMDEVAQALDDLASAASKQGAKDPAWARLQRAVREDRDKFPWPAEMGPAPETTLDDGTRVKGWSAFHTLASRDLASLQQRMLDAGIPAGKNILREQAAAGVRQNAIGFREPNRGAKDEALMSFMGGQTGPLWDIQAANIGRSLSRVPTSRSSAVQQIRMRFDPIADVVGRRGIPLGVAATTGKLGPGVVGAARDIRNATPFTLQDMMDLLRGKPQKEERP